METPYKEALIILKQREDTELEKKREYLVNKIVDKLEQVKSQEEKLSRVKEELENLKKMKAEDVVLPSIGSNSITYSSSFKLYNGAVISSCGNFTPKVTWGNRL